MFFALASSALALGPSGGGTVTPPPPTVDPVLQAEQEAAANSGSINNIPTQISPSVNNVPGGSNVTLVNPLRGGGDLMTFLQNILDFVIEIGTVVVVLMLVYVGYLFVAAQGNETKITEARNALLWTVVGALILLGSKAIAIGIEATAQALSVGG